MTSFSRNFVALFLALVITAMSCSIEKRLHRPGFHFEWNTSVDAHTPNFHVTEQLDEAHASIAKEFESEVPVMSTKTEPYDFFPTLNQASGEPQASFSSRCTRETEHIVLYKPSLSPDTLKKPFKPQKQYREIDQVGKYAVITVLAAVALQKIAGMLTWFEVIMPLTFGPGVFIPALIVALVGLGLSAYSAYRVRKYPEKYRKNEWGKAALAILGWQILMSVLFAWLLGGLPTG
jgi:hypothetical protein